MSTDRYDQDEGINWSTLRHMRTSPLQYRHAVDSPDEDTTRFGMGRAIHSAILQPDRLQLDYAVYEGPRRAGKAWDAFEEANGDKTILKADEWETVCTIADRVNTNPVAKEWINHDMALIERPITWTDAITGLACKGRPDAVHSAVIDVKSTTTIDERIFRATATRLGYFGQLAFYRRGYRALTGMSLKCAIVAVETDAPHDVAVFVLDEASLAVADNEITLLLKRVAECRASGKWPGRYQDSRALALPDWAMRDEQNQEWEAA